MTNQLTQLLQTKYPSSLTRRIELDQDFLEEVKKFSDPTLDLSFYPELEYLIAQTNGPIRQLNLQCNPELRELVFVNQELTGILDLSKQGKLTKLDITNNRLEQIRVHADIYFQTKKWFNKNAQPVPGTYRINYQSRQPQKHNSDKIQFQDITGVTPLQNPSVNPDPVPERNESGRTSPTNSNPEIEREGKKDKLEQTENEQKDSTQDTSLLDGNVKNIIITGVLIGGLFLVGKWMMGFLVKLVK